MKPFLGFAYHSCLEQNHVLLLRMWIWVSYEALKLFMKISSSVFKSLLSHSVYLLKRSSIFQTLISLVINIIIFLVHFNQQSVLPHQLVFLQGVTMDLHIEHSRSHFQPLLFKYFHTSNLSYFVKTLIFKLIWHLCLLILF
jgi:hypothetical protein